MVSGTITADCRCNQRMFPYMSIKSLANIIRNTEKIYNFVIVGYCSYFAIKLQSSLVI